MGERCDGYAALLLATRPLDREADRAARLVDAVARNFSPRAPMTFRMVSNHERTKWSRCLTYHFYPNSMELGNRRISELQHRVRFNALIHT